MSEGSAVTLNGLDHLGAMARGGAQAVKGPLHADRCVQQYGLLLEANGPREGRGRWGLGPFVWSLIELGVSYAADARHNGRTTLKERLTDGKQPRKRARVL